MEIYLSVSICWAEQSPDISASFLPGRWTGGGTWSCCFVLKQNLLISVQLHKHPFPCISENTGESSTLFACLELQVVGFLETLLAFIQLDSKYFYFAETFLMPSLCICFDVFLVSLPRELRSATCTLLQHVIKPSSHTARVFEQLCMYP